jgi:hypothetical protein
MCVGESADDGGNGGDTRARVRLCMKEGGREKGGARERGRVSDRGREREREKESEKELETERDRERQREREREREIERERAAQTMPAGAFVCPDCCGIDQYDKELARRIRVIR